MGGVLRSVFLVSLLAAWSVASNWLYDALGVENPGAHWALRPSLILLGTLVTVGGVVWLGCMRWSIASLRELGWCFEGWPRLLALGAALTLVYALLIFVTVLCTGGSNGVASFATAVAAVSGGTRLYFLLMGAKVAFVEETLFRGALLRSLQARLGAAAAVLISSALFALFHLDLTPSSLLLKMLYGAIAALATLRTGSLLPAALAHTLTWAIFADN